MEGEADKRKERPAILYLGNIRERRATNSTQDKFPPGCPWIWNAQRMMIVPTFVCKAGVYSGFCPPTLQRSPSDLMLAPSPINSLVSTLEGF